MSSEHFELASSLTITIFPYKARLFVIWALDHCGLFWLHLATTTFFFTTAATVTLLRKTKKKKFRVCESAKSTHVHGHTTNNKFPCLGKDKVKCGTLEDYGSRFKEQQIIKEGGKASL